MYADWPRFYALPFSVIQLDSLALFISIQIKKGERRGKEASLCKYARLDIFTFFLFDWNLFDNILMTVCTATAL
jgi:hypothetical protein